MTKKMEKTYTFWSLIENYSIEIPIIQRDYVQGRKKEKRVRTTFLKAIYDCLIKDKNLHLDFIYGVLKNDKFIPLDGQQRLTTLFLVHYFLSLKDNKFNRFQKHLTQGDNIKFSYETRKSSMEFCNQLIHNKIDYQSDIKISELIKNKNWFFSKWIQDPTISSMLTMLDEIQNIFKDDGLFEKLISNELVTFSFLKPEQLKIKNENELYIKMNSRGKPLNEFENFKSYFMDFLDENQKLKFDNEWFEIFWSQHNEKLKKNDIKENEKIIEENIFGAYLNFFENITPFFSKTKEKQDILKFDYSKNIKDIEIVLDCLIDYKDSEIYEIRDFETFKINIFQDFLLNDQDLTYEKRARFYVLMLFFKKIGKANKNKKLFKSWMRISLNIIHNTIFNKLDDFIKILNLLDELSEYLGKNFYQKLANSDLQDTEQFKEEKQKAKLILSNLNKWEEEFLKAEKHWYLDGKIRFLLNYANNDFDKFVEYKDKFIKLWDFIKKNKDNQILLYQTLLTKGDYLPKIGRNYTFCNFETAIRAKSDTWHKVFNDKIKSIYLKELLDDFNENDIQKSLENIKQHWIEKYDCNNSDTKTKYLYTLISNSENIKYCNKHQIRFVSYNEVYLLKKTQMNGTHAELYSYHLFTKFFKNNKFPAFTKTWYFETSSYEQPCAVINIHKNYAIDIYFNNGFEIYFYKKKNEDLIKISNPRILNIFRKFKFEETDEYSFKNINIFSLCEMKKLIKFIGTFLKEIVNHT